MRPGGRWVNLVWLGSFVRVDGFIRGRWVHSGAPFVSSVSFGTAGFIRVRLGGVRVHSGAPWVSSGSLG